MRGKTSVTLLLAVLWFAAVPVRGEPSEGGQGLATGVSAEPAKQAAEEPAERVFDAFDGKLELDWKPVRPDATHVSLDKHPGKLTITTQHGSIHHSAEVNRERGAPPAKNIYLVDNPVTEGPGFVVTTCLESFQPTTPFQQAGLIVYNDDENYVKWVCEFSSRGEPILNFIRETAGESSLTNLLVKPDLERLWLRLTRRGNHYQFASSADGEVFTVYGELPWGDGPPKQIGLLAKNGSPPKAGEVDAPFDFFEARPLGAAEKNEPHFVDRQKLQGTWTVVSCQLSGKTLEKAPLSRFAFTDRMVTIREQAKSVQGDYTLDVTGKPKQMVLSALLGSTSGQLRAAYSLEGDTLVICLDLRQGAPAPGSLETNPGDRRMLVTLQRAEAEEQE